MRGVSDRTGLDPHQVGDVFKAGGKDELEEPEECRYMPEDEHGAVWA